MKLKKITLKNIRSYESGEIAFPIGSLLLSGDVGAGKTSILLAIEYALFGLQPGQTGASLLRNDSMNGEVILELEIDGREIVIERRLKRGSKSVLNDYACISINGEKKEYSVTELKTKILNIIGYPLEFIKKNNLLYRYTVYTPQEQMKQIILEDPQTRLNVLRHVFGIDKYKLISDNLSIVLGKLKDDSKTLQGEIKDLELNKQGIENEKKHLEIIMAKVDGNEKSLKESIHKREKLEGELKSLEAQLKGRDKLETELEKTKVMAATKEENLFEIRREIIQLEKTLKEEVKFEESELKNTVQEILNKRIALDKINSRHIELIGRLQNQESSLSEFTDKKKRVFSINICPTCLQDVPDAHKHNILNETEGRIVNIRKEIDDLNSQRASLTATIDKERFDLIQLEERKLKLEVLKSKQEIYRRTSLRLAELTRLEGSLDKDILMLRKHLETTKQDLLKFSKFDNAQKSKKEELKQALEGEKREEISLAELKKEIELKNLEIDTLKKNLAEKEKSKEKLGKILDIGDWLSNYFLSLIEFTERSVMMTLRNEFSDFFKKWFEILAGESFEARLDENFTPIIMQGGVEMDYSFLSGGERTAVALAYRLALNQTINSVLSQIKTRDIVILDEPTEGFSEAQIDKMREIFNELEVNQIIIVSHEQKIEGLVDNVIKLKKEDNFSMAAELADK